MKEPGEGGPGHAAEAAAAGAGAGAGGGRRPTATRRRMVPPGVPDNWLKPLSEAGAATPVVRRPVARLRLARRPMTQRPVTRARPARSHVRHAPTPVPPLPTPTRRRTKHDRHGRRRPPRPHPGLLPGRAPAGGPDGAQGDGAHAVPRRPDVRRRLPRLGPARRRRREVRAEGGRGPGRRRPPRLPARAGRRADPVPGRACHDPDRARHPGRPRPRRRTVLRARRDGRQCPGLAHGRLGQRQQVLAARRHPQRRAADGLRAAVHPRRVLRRDGRRDAVPDRHRRGLAPVVGPVAADRPGRVLHRRAGRAPAAAVRHAGRRLGDHLRRVHGVHGHPLRPVPAGRVRRDRAAEPADRGPVPRRLARPVLPGARPRRLRLVLDAAEDLRTVLPRDLAPRELPAPARGPAAETGVDRH